MSVTRCAAIVLSLLFAVSCGAISGASPASPSALPSSSTGLTSPPSSPTAINGTVGPLGPEARPCFADLYPCAAFDFELPREGAIEVTLTWDGDPRALRVQLYWEGQWLAHEDVAPPGGPSHISFRRPRMEANHYQVRVVSMEPQRAIPFRLVLNY